jgi:hypothetical protein
MKTEIQVSGYWLPLFLIVFRLHWEGQNSTTQTGDVTNPRLRKPDANAKPRLQKPDARKNLASDP